MDRKKQLFERYETLSASDKKSFKEQILGVAIDEAEDKKKQFEYDSLDFWHDEIKERQENFGNPIGLLTGNWVIDKMTMGFAPGEVTIIAGSTSGGKTMTAINIAADLVKLDKIVMFVTLEMTHGEVGARFATILGDDYERLESSILLQKSDEMDWDSIDGLMRKVKEEALVDIVIIDHLHYFGRGTSNVAEEIGKITKEFKKNALRHKLPVILISHTRKAPDSFTTKTGINDLRGSSYIAQDADIVLMVHRDLKHYPDDIIISLAKNRNRFGVPVGTECNFELRGVKLIHPSRHIPLDKFNG